MALDLSNEEWAQIRYEYEYTDKPVEEICAERGISSGTLRDRMRRWGWTRRRPPVPRDGPPPAGARHASSLLDAPFVDDVGARHGSPLPEAPTEDVGASDGHNNREAGQAPPLPDATHAAGDEADPAAIVPRLQGAVARVLPAIEANLARLGVEAMHPREMERAARGLGALTRTLRELNTLLSEQQSHAPAGRICNCDDDMPENIDEFRIDLARRIEAWAASRIAAGDGPQPQDT